MCQGTRKKENKLSLKSGEKRETIKIRAEINEISHRNTLK